MGQLMKISDRPCIGLQAFTVKENINKNNFNCGYEKIILQNWTYLFCVYIVQLIFMQNISMIEENIACILANFSVNFNYQIYY